VGQAIKQLGLCDYNKKIIRMSLPLAVSNLKEGMIHYFRTSTRINTKLYTITNGKKLVLNWVQQDFKNITARRQHLPKKKNIQLTCPCCNYATKSRKSSSSSSCPKCDKNIMITLN
jgi:uncharacterized paraquat-inducible protein A